MNHRRESSEETEVPFGLGKLPFARSKVTITVGGLIAVFLFGLYCQRYFDDFRHELQANFASIHQDITAKAAELTKRIDANETAIKTGAVDRFKGADAENWAIRIERANRDVQRKDGTLGLIIPEPLDHRGREKPDGG